MQATKIAIKVDTTRDMVGDEQLHTQTKDFVSEHDMFTHPRDQEASYFDPSTTDKLTSLN
jgi:hypothetical protein